MRFALSVALTLVLAGPALGQELSGTLRKIKDSGTFTIGYREQSVPFSFLDRDGKPAGYSITPAGSARSALPARSCS
jgi:glutamate/aspartate transport system substrate-binding protein